MRLHEFHSIGQVESMAGASHPGELIDVPRPVLERHEPRTHKFGGVGERPLWSAFRTQIGHRGGSEKCQERKSGALFDHLVGNRKHARRNRQAQRLGGLHVNGQLELGWLQNRQIGRFSAH